MNPYGDKYCFNIYHRKYILSFKTVQEFEQEIALFYNAPYAVATDCCTHAIELCLRLTKPTGTISVPTNTYISVPFTLEKLNVEWKFKNDKWVDYYFLGNTNIVDAAVYFKSMSYIANTLMCLSFQFKKPLGLGRGGAILCDNWDQYIQLKKMAYDGRVEDIPWAEQSIDTIGYHYYMTPETAQMGLDKLPVVAKKTWPQWSWENYPDLTLMPVFKKEKVNGR